MCEWVPYFQLNSGVTNKKKEGRLGIQGQEVVSASQNEFEHFLLSQIVDND